MVGTSVVIAEELYGQGNTQVVVQEASEEGVSLVIADGLLVGPVSVTLGEPEEVVVA